MFANLLVLKLGLVRFATSLLVVLLVNVLNRVLIVDLLVPAALVTFSFGFQHIMAPVGLISGYFSDNYSMAGRYRAPYIWGGMLLSIAVMPFFPLWAQALGANPHHRGLLYQGVLLFSLFGIGTTVSATAINALLVDRVPEPERGAALTLVWIITLGGFIFGSFLISFLFPVYDPQNLELMFLVIALVVLLITLWGAWGVEPPYLPRRSQGTSRSDFWKTLRFLGGNGQIRAFFAFLMATVFFLAIQTFLLTPFGGEVLALPVSQTSRFGVYISYGVLMAMVVLHVVLSLRKTLSHKKIMALSLIVGGMAFTFLSLVSFRPSPEGGVYALWFLGISKGLYNVSISHLTMSMAHPAFSGIFMGLWNLVSGIALAGGEMMGGFLKDGIVHLVGGPQGAYGWIFLFEGLGLLACLLLLLPIKPGAYRASLAVWLSEQKEASPDISQGTNKRHHPDESR
jgi:BCD family chlorophyll transporter-like MFS transporter